LNIDAKYTSESSASKKKFTFQVFKEKKSGNIAADIFTKTHKKKLKKHTF